MTALSHVLSIDDDHINNFLMTQAFQRVVSDEINFKAVTNVDDAFQELNLYEKDNETFPDLILVDINLPLKNGFDFLDEYEKRFFPENKNCRLIMLTSSIRESDAEKAKSYSAVTGFYSKSEVISLVNKIVETHFS
ncbi:response regulator [Flexithrix dorotheae]|uniref:response regulator n=1 Tax=Flexithrix dorotheae TaxID=70993 RepID=UPI0003A61C53|nr:response regulator [Flexithrix dorotheae]